MTFFIISAIINAFIAGVLGLVVIIKNRKELINKLFFGLSVSVVFWSIGYWQWLSSGDASLALFWTRFFSIGSLFIPIFYFHWILAFTNLHIKNRNLIKFLYFFAFILLAFSFSDLFIEKVEPKSIFPFWPVPGILYHFYLIFIYLGLSIYSLIILFNQYRISTDIKKANIKYIILGSLIGFGGGATNFFLWYDIPIFPYGNVLISVYPIVLAIASLRYRLFNIKIIVAELLIFVLWAIFLARCFMADTLQQRIVEGGFFMAITIFGFLIIRSVLGEVRRREEVERISKELEGANERLKELDRTKTEFLSFATHQIKAPLTAVKGFASLVGGGSYGAVPEKVKEVNKRIVKAVDRLVDLVNNILNLGRIESGRMEYNFEEINFVDMVSEVVDELKLIADEKKLDLLFDVEVKETPKGTSAGSVPTGQVKIKADPQKLRQVIQNLIDNAIKYTPDGFVKVAITSEKDSVLFSVVDTGVGILPEFLPNLFQKFVRETAPGQRIQGTGLGLYIAKEIIKAHGGEIWAESEGRGFGSQFFVRLKKV